ncbi:TP901 family phage tail tape measure protein [Pseudomonas sp. RV120224-01c]|uniref:phage tail tape measure protein n=1 Tax=Pseudomonas sp. RV120224-01c TaxID=1378074 RepID=UPI000D8C79DF|nr:phage tail tape measure protein [Pseudomonas sp. RV120224-01c]PYG83233.1 TP901 family phage tail tape measure protein [Pseudomonas sp. RV120224-01c]
MASKLALALVIGGTVASSVGAAFKTVENGIQKLEAKGNRAKVLKSTIGETIKLREEWKRAHDSGAAGADKLLRKLDSNLDALRKQGVEVGRLSREYQRLGREARAADLQVKGHQQLQAGKDSFKSNIGKTVAATAAVAAPTMISANYQAIIRDIAIKADIANKPQEQQLTRTVIDTAADTGMARNGVADLVNQLVGAGMELDKALSYAPVAAKFAIGQGASGVDTASMIQALEQNAKISDPKVMQQALEAIAYQGQAGSFEASDMARWFPQLLANMEKSGITGIDAVTSLGSMLQVQMKTAGSSDEAANNLKNWIEKIGAGDVVKAYKDAGIDYQGSLNTGLQKGMNVIEASMALAMRYVEATDPAKAKKIEAAKASIDKEVDPEKARAALEALEKTLRTGDIFADMQVKAALTAYGQNRGLYEELKADSQKASGILDKNLAERRETSAQQWAETVQAADDAMRSIGDAIRPATDMAAKGLTAVAQGITKLSDGFPAVVMGIGGVVAAILAFKTASSAFKIGRGLLNIARGRRLGRAGSEDNVAADLPKTGSKVVDAGLDVLGKVFAPRSIGAEAANDPAVGGNDPQRVFVVNADAFSKIGGAVGSSGPAGPARGSRRSRRRERRRAKKGVPARPAVKADLPPVPAARSSTLPVATTVLAETNELGKVARSVRGVARLARRLPGGNVVDAGAAAIDVALNATTKDERAEGYGGAAGSLAGTLAGAAAGAAIGSVVPVIGTAVGGAVGAVLGGMGGESLGGWLGKRWFGDEQLEGEGRQVAPVLDAAERDQAKSVSPAATPVVVPPAAPPAVRVAAPNATPAAPVVVDNRDTVVVPSRVPAAPALGDVVRAQANPVPPATAPVVVPPAAAPAVRVTAPKATPAAPVVVDNRDPVGVPSPAAPALGDAVRGQAKPVPPAAPVVVPPAAAPAVRVTAPEATPTAPVVVNNRDPVAAPLLAPALGDAVRGQAKPVAPAAAPVVVPPAAPAVRVAAPEATPAAPVVVDNRDSVAVPSPAPAAPALGDAVRGQAKPVVPAAAPVVVPPAAAPAVRVTAPEATPTAPVVVDNRDPVAAPLPAAPALGDAVRGQAKPVAPAAGPVVVPPAAAPVVRVTAPTVTPTAPVVVDNRDPVAAPLPAPAAPALGDAVRGQAKPVEPASAPVVMPPATAPAVRVTAPAPKTAPTAPVVVDNRDPVASLLPVPAAPALGHAVRSQPKPSMPAPVPLLVNPEVMSAPREPMAKAAPVAPLVLVAPAPKAAQGVPAQAAPQPAPRADGLGDVVRDLAARAKPPAPRLPEPAKSATATPVKPPAPKVDMTFTFAPHMPITVHGDVKEPEQVVREIEAPLRRKFDEWAREVQARIASVQLYDQPHV